MHSHDIPATDAPRKPVNDNPDFDVERVRRLIDTTSLDDGSGCGPLGWVYFIVDLEVGRCKIGFTKGAVKKRLASLQTGSPCQLALLACHPGTVDSEQRLHRRFASTRVHGEWFQMSDELRAYLVRVVWTMSESSLAKGRPLETWMGVCLTIILDTFGEMPESLAALVEAQPA